MRWTLFFPFITMGICIAALNSKSHSKVQKKLAGCLDIEIDLTHILPSNSFQKNVFHDAIRDTPTNGQVILQNKYNVKEKHFVLNHSATSIFFDELAQGSWSISVTIYNSKGSVLIQGEKDIDIIDMETTMNMISLIKNGTLSMTTNIPTLLSPDGLLVWDKLEATKSARQNDINPNFPQRYKSVSSYMDFEKSTYFEESNNLVHIAPSILPTFEGNSFTFEFWYKPNYGFGNIEKNRIDDPTSMEAYLLSNSKKELNTGKQQGGFELTVRNDKNQKRKGTDISATYLFRGKLYYSKVVPGNEVQWKAGDWVHFAFVHDEKAGAFYVYVNNKVHLKKTKMPSIPTPLSPIAYRITPGRLLQRSSPRRGLLQQLRIWNFAKTSFNSKIENEIKQEQAPLSM